jgi:hypothetical protein
MSQASLVKQTRGVKMKGLGGDVSYYLRVGIQFLGDQLGLNRWTEFEIVEL